MTIRFTVASCVSVLVLVACNRAAPPPVPGPANLGEAWGTQLEKLPD